MTNDRWKEFQSTLRQYKSAEKTLDKLAAKTGEARVLRDSLVKKVRELMADEDANALNR